MEQFFTSQPVAVGVLVLLVLWLGKAVLRRIRLQRDTLAIEEWLWTHTEDEPGESHRSVAELARCLHLSEDRVNRAVAHSHAIFRSAVHVELVSVWRQEPQSLYEGRSLSVV